MTNYLHEYDLSLGNRNHEILTFSEWYFLRKLEESGDVKAAVKSVQLLEKKYEGRETGGKYTEFEGSIRKGIKSVGATLLTGSYLYELQMLNGVYRRITGNYTTNFPITGPNYSSDSNTDYRWVMFSYSITIKSSILVTVAGANMSTVAGSQITDNMKIFVKVEGSTGWISANDPYPGVGTPIVDGDFAMVTASSTSSTTSL